MNTIARKPMAGGLVAALLLAAGCGHNTSRPRVEGKVTFQGNPVAGKTLVLYSEGGGGSFFSQKIPLQADGSFVGEVPAPGTYKVAVEESLAAQERAKSAAGSGASLPAKYRDPATSGLAWTVQSGDNHRDFDLKD